METTQHFDQALFVMVKKKLTASIGVATILVNKFDPKKGIFTGLTLVLGISNLSPAGDINEL